MAEKVNDTWVERDYPVLREVAQRLDEEPGTYPEVRDIATALDMSTDDVTRAVLALSLSFMDIERMDFGQSGMPIVTIRRLTERGRRTAGLWPDENQVDAFVAALLEASNQAPTEEERSNLTRIAAGVVGAGRDVMTDVLSSVIVKATLGP